MKHDENLKLSRRERQLMDAVYRSGRASAAEVLKLLPDPPTNAAVRAMLGILVRKGWLKIEKDGPRYVYLPTRSRRDAGRSAIRRVVDTFFDGSLESTVAAVLDAGAGRLTEAEIARLKAIIDQPGNGGGSK
jgi:predicted transcriptional regulator